MTDSRASVLSLRHAVHAAFEAAVKPPFEDIAPHDCEDCARLREDFASVDWQSMPSAVIEEHSGALSHLSPRALPYYLPAFLTYALDHFSHDKHPTEMLVYHLAPDEATSEEHEEWWHDKLKYLTDDQVAVIERFMDLVEGDAEFSEFVGDLSSGRERWRRYWRNRWKS